MASVTLTPSSQFLVQQTAVLVSGSAYTANTNYYVHIIWPGATLATGSPFPRLTERQVVADPSGNWSFIWVPQVIGTFIIRVYTFPTQFINTMNPDMEVVRSSPALNVGGTTTITVGG